MTNSASRVRARRAQKDGFLVSKRRLVRLLVAVGGLVLLGSAAFALFLAGNRTAGTPHILVDPDVVDYGDVPLNTTINTVFTVKNSGDAPLKILGEPQVELVQGC